MEGYHEKYDECKKDWMESNNVPEKLGDQFMWLMAACAKIDCPPNSGKQCENCIYGSQLNKIEG